MRASEMNKLTPVQQSLSEWLQNQLLIRVASHSTLPVTKEINKIIK